MISVATPCRSKRETCHTSKKKRGKNNKKRVKKKMENKKMKKYEDIIETFNNIDEAMVFLKGNFHYNDRIKVTMRELKGKEPYYIIERG